MYNVENNKYAQSLFIHGGDGGPATHRDRVMLMGQSES